MVGTAEELAAYQAANKAVDERIAAPRGERDRAEWDLCKRLAAAGLLGTPAARTIVATSREQPQMWRYTEQAPPENWMHVDFDAAAWRDGPGGFGTEGTPGAAVHTRWASSDIWLRREIELSAEALADDQRARLHFSLHHDDSCEIYLNGVLAARIPGFTVEYKNVSITGDALAALKPGRNLLAIHCTQTTGGQYIDVGLVSAEPAPVATGGTRTKGPGYRPRRSRPCWPRRTCAPASSKRRSRNLARN